MKSENARLLQSISDLQNKLTEKDQEEMSKDAIHQLSKMVKDKDLEIEGLKSLFYRLRRCSLFFNV